MTVQDTPRPTPVALPTTLPDVPWLPPVLRRVWRAPGVLQIGADAERAVVLRNVTAELAAFIAGLDGTRSTRQLVEQAPVGPEPAARVLETLARAGVVVDLAESAGDRPIAAEHPALSGRLAPELYGRALGHLASSPAAAMRARSSAHVVIVGGPRLGPAVASILAAGGIGRLAVVLPGQVGPGDLVPGGPTAQDVGRDRYAALRDAVGRISPSVRLTQPGASDHPDLVVITEPVDPAGDRPRMLMRTGTPFLSALVRERRGVIGPFVIPGRSSCLQCQAAVRRELDRHWATVQTQLLSSPPPPGDGGEATLVMLTAALVGTQVLQWVDGERSPETIEATLEIALPELVLERRYWPRHDLCSCAQPRGSGTLYG